MMTKEAVVVLVVIESEWVSAFPPFLGSSETPETNKDPTDAKC